MDENDLLIAQLGAQELSMVVGQEEFDKSAAGRAAKAQMKAMKEAKASSNQGEPVLKVSLSSVTRLKMLTVNESLLVLGFWFWEDAAQSFSDV
uniref:Uncharacterized protein n=1 Tax=Oryza brachyantha TaxID=4533 RepID=J3NDP8_ORYBR